MFIVTNFVSVYMYIHKHCQTQSWHDCATSWAVFMHGGSQAVHSKVITTPLYSLLWEIHTSGIPSMSIHNTKMAPSIMKCQCLHMCICPQSYGTVCGPPHSCLHSLQALVENKINDQKIFIQVPPVPRLLYIYCSGIPKCDMHRSVHGEMFLSLARQGFSLGRFLS